jgi:hypothetical protein
MKKAFPTPLVSLSERQPLDISVRRTQSDLLAVHFVNVSGSHETEPVINEISPVRDVIVMLNLPQKPSSLRLEPSGRSLEFEWNDGIATVVIPSIPIYEILLVN